MPVLVLTSAAVAAALAAAAADAPPDDCPACLEPANRGLCHAERCQRQVLPTLKGPSWQRDAHSGMYHETAVGAAEQAEADVAAERHAALHAKRESALARQAAAAERCLGQMRGAPFRRNRQRRAA